MKSFAVIPLLLLTMPLNAAMAADCEDTGLPGDGWGWDGENSCRIVVSAGACIDFDGDGWGWNGVSSCVTDVQVTDSDVAYAVPPTGQTTSYANGDDADQQTTPIRPSRFTSDGNGSFTDRLTGLVWLSVRQCIFDQTWFSALNFTEQLSAGGSVCEDLNDGSVVGDWRLPNIDELQSFIDYERQNPVFAANMPFTGFWDDYPWGRYWSSTSFVADPDQNAWILNSGFGQVSVYEKTNVARAFAVRDR